jgi:hypothetical protein
MNELKEELEKQIIKNRENIKASSVKTYISCLSNLIKKMDGELDVKFFDNTKKILAYLDDKTPVQRKTCLSALFILTKNEDYQKPMLEDIKIVNSQYKEQVKSKKESANWIEQEDLQAFYNTYLKIANDIFKKKEWTNSDITELQKYFLLVFLGGYFFPPRRSQDFTELKLKNFDKEKDNFYYKGCFYFNVYKTAKSFGEQKIELPSEIDKQVKKYIKKIDNEYFFFNPKTGNKLTSPNITLMINSIFGKRVSTNLLRHIYLSNKYKDVPAIKQMDATATAMGHDLRTSLEMYVKH